MSREITAQEIALERRKMAVEERAQGHFLFHDAHAYFWRSLQLHYSNKRWFEFWKKTLPMDEVVKRAEDFVSQQV